MYRKWTKFRKILYYFRPHTSIDRVLHLFFAEPKSFHSPSLFLIKYFPSQRARPDTLPQKRWRKLSSLIAGPAGGHLRQVWCDKPGGGEDLLQPGCDAEAGQPAPERVVRGRPQVQAGRDALPGHGEDRQGRGTSVSVVISVQTWAFFAVGQHFASKRLFPPTAF